MTATATDRFERPYRLVALMLFVGMLLLSAWDIYFPQIFFPITEIGGTFILLTAALMISRPRYTAHIRRHYLTVLGALALTATLLLNTLWGAALSGSVYSLALLNIKAAFGIELGVVIFTVVLFREESDAYRNVSLRCLDVLLYIHVTFWIIQFVWFFVHPGQFLDFIQPITGVPTRNRGGVFGVATVFRFSGLFVEPAKYANFVFMGLTIRMLQNRFRLRRFDWLLISTMLASLSITGVFLALLVMIVSAIKTGRIIRFLIIAAIISVTGGAFVIRSDSSVAAFLRFRLTSPVSSASGQYRFTNPLDFYSQLSEDKQLFGIGLGNYGENFIAGNSVSFLLVNTGLIGMLVFAAIIIGLLYLRRLTPLAWIFVGFSVVESSLMTNQFWWFWIAMLTIFSHAPPSKAGQAESLSRMEGLTGLPPST